MTFLKIIIIIVAAYLLGSTNIAVVITKYIMKDDVRQKGSGNAGATNVARVFGMRFGIITLLGDVLKTVIAVIIGWLILGRLGITIACAACFAGHCWPVFFGFKGGKGVAVGAVIIASLDWRVLLISLGMFIVVFIFTRMVSASSIMAAISFPVALLLISAPLWYEALLAIAAACAVCALHRKNIVRIFNHTESKFKLKK